MPKLNEKSAPSTDQDPVGLKPASVAVTRLSQKEISQWTTKFGSALNTINPSDSEQATNTRPTRRNKPNPKYMDFTPEPTQKRGRRVTKDSPSSSPSPSVTSNDSNPLTVDKLRSRPAPASRKRRASASNTEEEENEESEQSPQVKKVANKPKVTFKPSGIPTTPQLAVSSSSKASPKQTSTSTLNPASVAVPIQAANAPATTYYVIQQIPSASQTPTPTLSLVVANNANITSETQSKPTVTIVPALKKDEKPIQASKGVSITPVPTKKKTIGVTSKPRATSTPIAPKPQPRLIAPNTAKMPISRSPSSKPPTIIVTRKSGQVDSVAITQPESSTIPSLTSPGTKADSELAPQFVLLPAVTSSSFLTPSVSSNSNLKLTKVVTFTPGSKKLTNPSTSTSPSAKITPTTPTTASPTMHVVSPMPAIASTTSSSGPETDPESTDNTPTEQVDQVTPTANSTGIEVETASLAVEESNKTGTSTATPPLSSTQESTGSNLKPLRTYERKGNKNVSASSGTVKTSFTVILPPVTEQTLAKPIDLDLPTRSTSAEGDGKEKEGEEVTKAIDLPHDKPAIDISLALREIFAEHEETSTADAVTETVEVETTTIDEPTFLICFPGTEDQTVIGSAEVIQEVSVVGEEITEVPSTVEESTLVDETVNEASQTAGGMEWEENEVIIQEEVMEAGEGGDGLEGGEEAETTPGGNLAVLTEEDCLVEVNGASHFECPYCPEQGKSTKVAQWNELVGHCLTVHQKVVQKRATVQCLETGCKARYNRIQAFRDHLQNVHNKPAASEYYVFPNIEAFMAWKLEEEDRTGNQFIRASGKRKPTLTGEVRAYFYCKRRHMRKAVPNTGQRKRSSYERSHSCVANMSIAESIVDGKVRLDYCPYHYGHTSNVAHNWLNVKEKTLVLRLIEQGLLPLEIVQKVTSGAIPGTSNRLKLLTGKDIFNVEKWAGIRSLERKHDDDEMSMDMWGAELAAEGTAVVYKPMGVQDEAGLLTTEAFFLVVITEPQAELLKKHGPDGVIVVECVRIISTSEMHLITLLVLDKETSKQAYLGAVGFCNQIGAETIQSFVATIYSKVGAVHPKTVLSEDPQTLAAIWEYVMGQAPPESFIPSWAVEFHWDEHMKLIPDQGKQAGVRKYLQVLLEEKEEVAGGSLLTLVRSMLTPSEDCHEFLQYFEDTFGWQVDFWAGWKRPYDIELHKPIQQLKEVLDKIVFRAKKVKRVDKCLYGMIWFVHNKLDDLNDNWSEFNLVASNTLVQVPDLSSVTDQTDLQPLSIPETTSTPQPQGPEASAPSAHPAAGAKTNGKDHVANDASPSDGKTVQEFACKECDVLVRCLHSHECSCKLSQVHAVMCKHIHVQMLDKQKPNVIRDHFTVHMSKPIDADTNNPELLDLKKSIFDKLQLLANAVANMDQPNVLKKLEQDLKHVNTVLANRPKGKIVVTIPDKKKKT